MPWVFKNLDKGLSGISTWALILDLIPMLERPIFLKKKLKFSSELNNRSNPNLFKRANFHNLNLFRLTCDFPVEWIATSNLQGKVSHYLKSILCQNEMNRIVNKMMQELKALTISLFDNFVTKQKQSYINPQNSQTKFT